VVLCPYSVISLPNTNPHGQHSLCTLHGITLLKHDTLPPSPVRVIYCVSLSPDWDFSGSVHTTHYTCVSAFQFSHEGNGHANPTEPQHAPASPGGHCSGVARWELGEGGDASTMLKVEKGMHKCSYLYVYAFHLYGRWCVCVCASACVCVCVYERERV